MSEEAGPLRVQPRGSQPHGGQARNGQSQGGVYRFERFTLDTVRGALLAAGGTEVALRPKAFVLLVRLVESAGRLVDRDEIMQAVWPDVVVTDDSISQCVREIRRALGDADQRLVRTLPRRGFVFAAEVLRGDGTATLVVVPEAAPPDPAVPVPGLASGRPVVTLLPFEAIGGHEGGGGGSGGAFADGLTADLATDLTRFCDLQVVRSRHSAAGLGAARVAEGRAAIGSAGSYVVSGAVRLGAGRVRVTAQVEDAETGAQLWAERFDRPLDDPFIVQEELAGRLASLIAAQVDHESGMRALRRLPASLDVYDLCLRGQQLYARVTEADTLRARALFDQAIAADPLYALAHTWQAWTVQRGFFHWWGEPTGVEACRLALTYARRAVALERDSAFCRSRLAVVLLRLQRHDEALDAAREAVRLNPRSSGSRYALADALTHTGDPEAGVKEARLSLELDPFHLAGMRNDLGRALLVAGRLDEAEVVLRQVAAELPDYGLCWHNLAVLAVEAERMEDARAAVRETLRIQPRWTLSTIAPLWPFRDPAQSERVQAAFRAAGLPEG